MEVNQPHTYSYGDPGDVITSALVGAETSAYARYWRESEARIFDLIDDHIDRHRSTVGDRARSYLDAGCGHGRLLPRFAARFDRTVALEPDGERLEVARSSIAGSALAATVEFRRAMVQELAMPGEFDVILSSHILQHLHSADVAAVLDAMIANLRDGGLLLLTTCHSTTGVDCHERCDIKGDVVRRRPVSRQEFDAAVYAGDGALMSRYFSRSSIAQALLERGLEVGDFRIFHLSRDELRGRGESCAEWLAFEDEANREPSLQRRVGEDMFVVARKP